MGWTCGNGMASARDVAKFFYDLLGPEYKIVSKEGVEVMNQFRRMDKGFSAGGMDYGGGLFT